ncbi:HxsD-like protein [Candidatus Woesearchaeota archaeon]|nr:HxsD-like protein [Candidatus Woesearchaeota archaeon]
MERIEVDGKLVKLSFNKDFYSDKAIEQTIADFAEVCHAKWEGELLVLTPKEMIDLDELGREFYNYVLGIMKNG